MNQHEHLGIVDAAQRDAAEIADPHVDSHPHALDGTPKHDAFAVKFYPAHAAIRTDVMRIEADRQRERSSRNARLDPAGLIPPVAV